MLDNLSLYRHSTSDFTPLTEHVERHSFFFFFFFLLTRLSHIFDHTHKKRNLLSLSLFSSLPAQITSKPTLCHWRLSDDDDEEEEEDEKGGGRERQIKF